MIDRVQVRSPDPHNSHLIGRIGSIVGMKNRHISVLLDNTDTAHLFLPRELTLKVIEENDLPDTT